MCYKDKFPGKRIFGNVQELLIISSPQGERE